MRDAPLFERIAAPQSQVVKAAEISQCGLYRYRLTRTWDQGAYLLPFVMLNPSTADASIDDPTIRRCMGFARRENFGGIVVVNLFAFRAVDPKALKTTSCPVGPQNEFVLEDVMRVSNSAQIPIVCAWGSGAAGRGLFWVQRARAHGAHLVCLGMTKDGHPRHPLYVRGDQPLIPFGPSP